MSNISARLVPDPNNGIIMNAGVFGWVMTSYLTGDVGATQARAFLDRHIIDNGGVALTGPEVTDVAAIKDHYNAMTEVNQAKFLTKVQRYSEILQGFIEDPAVTETWWDSEVGL